MRSVQNQSYLIYSEMPGAYVTRLRMTTKDRRNKADSTTNN